MTQTSNVTVSDIEVHADSLDVQRAAAIYKTHGCLVVRGLMKRWVPTLSEQIDAVIAETIELIPEARKVTEGWSTPNGSLLLPAPQGYHRDKQIMTLPINYRNSSAFFQSALDEKVLDVVEAALGPDIELFGEGQSLVKEPVGGHPKHLHQDAAYFEHRFEGPMATLNYVVDTDLNNGCLHVVPGSHKLEVLQHEDTFSHLGLNPDDWPWEKALPVEGKAGDTIFFHVKTIHGSKENHSQGNRPVFIHRYRRADDYIVVSGTTVENREAAAKQREQAKKDNQKGLMVRGFRRFDRERQANA